MLSSSVLAAIVSTLLFNPLIAGAASLPPQDVGFVGQNSSHPSFVLTKRADPDQQYNTLLDKLLDDLGSGPTRVLVDLIERQYPNWKISEPSFAARFKFLFSKLYGSDLAAVRLNPQNRAQFDQIVKQSKKTFEENQNSKDKSDRAFQLRLGTLSPNLQIQVLRGIVAKYFNDEESVNEMISYIGKSVTPKESSHTLQHFKKQLDEHNGRYQAGEGKSFLQSFADNIGHNDIAKYYLWSVKLTIYSLEDRDVLLDRLYGANGIGKNKQFSFSEHQ